MQLIGDLFTKAFALLAFLLAFYTLVARERKSPYITNFIYSSAIWFFAAVILQLVKELVGSSVNWLATGLAVFSNLLFAIGSLNVGYGIWRIHNRLVNFRDDVQLKALRPVRLVRRTWSNIRKKPSYEYLAPSIATGSLELFEKTALEISNLKLSPSSALEAPQCVVMHGLRVQNSDEYLVALAKAFLGTKKWTLQYTTCIRHPKEFLDKILDFLKEEGLYSQVAVVDAYTPHFGFTDSIHIKRTEALEELGIHCVTSTASFAGIHTATAKAFNKFKRQQSASRLPAFIIYEGPFALADLESVEQYKIFIRHVLPSERMWGGMLTCLVEPVITDEILAVPTSYADLVVSSSLQDDQTTRIL
jgi:hypothetical protein